MQKYDLELSPVQKYDLELSPLQKYDLELSRHRDSHPKIRNKNTSKEICITVHQKNKIKKSLSIKNEYNFPPFLNLASSEIKYY